MPQHEPSGRRGVEVDGRSGPARRPGWGLATCSHRGADELAGEPVDALHGERGPVQHLGQPDAGRDRAAHPGTVAVIRAARVATPSAVGSGRPSMRMTLAT